MSWLRGRLGDERGFTLIELLTTILIGIVVMSAAMGLTEVGARSTARTTDRVETIQRSRTALALIVQGLRSQVCADSVTPPVISGDGSSITYHSDVDDTAAFVPQKRRLTLSGGSIVEQLWRPSPATGPPWTYPATPTRTRTLLAEAGTVDTTPFLTYYSFDAVTPLSVPLSSDTTTTPLPVNSIAKVVRIDVSFRTRPATRDADANDSLRWSDLQSSVYVRNTDYTDLSSTTNNRTWGPRCS